MLTSPLNKLCVIVYASRSLHYVSMLTSPLTKLRVIFYFYHTYSSSAESAYIIPIFTTITSSFLAPIKRQHRTHFTHSSAGQRQRHYYLMASNNIDELQNLERIEQLCRNLRHQRQQEQQQPLSATG